MQVEWFQSFVETVHCKSLSKAGEKLNVSQTALSKQMRNLEDSFGVTLFHRSATGMELTPEGKLLFEKAERWLTEIEETKRQLVNLSAIKHVVLGSLPSISAHYLPEKVLRLKSAGVRAEMQIFNTTEEVLYAFQNGVIDAAILERNIHIPNIYASKDLFTEPYYAVVPRSHPLASKESVKVSDIAQESLIVYPENCDVRRSLVQSFDVHGVTPSIGAEIPFGESILGFVAAGAGMTIVPATIANHIGDSALVSVPIEDYGVHRTICLVAKSSDQVQFLHRFVRPGKSA